MTNNVETIFKTISIMSNLEISKSVFKISINRDQNKYFRIT